MRDLADRVDRRVARVLPVAAIGGFISRFYNSQRRDSALGYLRPIEFELRLKSGREAA
jgi:hypothetical protein